MASLGVAAAASAGAAQGQAETYKMTREMPVERGWDLIVAGGGPSGAAAAICAARLGAKVLLIEATGCMGGMGTNAYVSNWYSMSDGEKSVIGGLILELSETLCKEGNATPESIEMYRKGEVLSRVGFNPEALKSLFDRLCAQAGVEVRFYTRVIDVDVDRQKKNVNGVVTSNVEGYRYITAKTFVDGTGDGVLSLY
jgi:glycine/D-amino acid oxidase-like deaminating enzyme